MLAVMPCPFGTPPGPGTNAIEGDMRYDMVSRIDAYRESDMASPMSWFAGVTTLPEILHTREGEFGGPHRSLYVRLLSGSTWNQTLGGLPVERHTSVTPSAGGRGKRLSMALPPPCSGFSKSPNT